MPADSMLAELRDAVFGYGRRPVVRAAHLTISPGECLGVYGPNGSGKTTLVRGMTGLLSPMSGSATRRAGLRCGYLPQRRDLDARWPMTGFDAAAVAISARRPMGWLDAASRASVRASMGELGVHDLAARRFATLSGGQQQRLMLAGALAAGSDLLVLDEPTDGLDASSRIAFLSAVRAALAGGLAVVLVSHDVEDLSALASRVARVRPPAESTGVGGVDCLAPGELLTPATFSDPAQRAERVEAAR